MINEKWVKLRQLGKRKYVLLYGSLFWGCICSTAVITPIIYKNKIDSIFSVFIYYIVWIIGGYFYGAYSWEKHENKFKK